MHLTGKENNGHRGLAPWISRNISVLVNSISRNTGKQQPRPDIAIGNRKIFLLRTGQN